MTDRSGADLSLVSQRQRVRWKQVAIRMGTSRYIRGGHPGMLRGLWIIPAYHISLTKSSPLFSATLAAKPGSSYGYSPTGKASSMVGTELHSKLHQTEIICIANVLVYQDKSSHMGIYSKISKWLRTPVLNPFNWSLQTNTQRRDDILCMLLYAEWGHLYLENTVFWFLFLLLVAYIFLNNSNFLLGSL